MVQDLIHFDTWHFALVTTCVCVYHCNAMFSAIIITSMNYCRGEEDPRQLYGQFAFNSVSPKRTSNYQTISLFIFTTTFLGAKIQTSEKLKQKKVWRENSSDFKTRELKLLALLHLCIFFLLFFHKILRLSKFLDFQFSNLHSRL